MATLTALAKIYSIEISAIQRYLGLAKFLSSENFHLYGNSKNLSKWASRGSGGGGMLIKNSLLKKLNTAVLENKFEGLLHKQ